MSALSPMFEDSLFRLFGPLADACHARAAPTEKHRTDQDAWSDETLVDAIINRGSQQHFRTLMARHKSRVHQLCLSVLGPSQQAQAEDAAQEVFIRLYQRLDSFRGDCKFSTWLHRLAINCAIDFQRKNCRVATTDFDETQLTDTAHNAPGLANDRHHALRVQQAINLLPQSQRMMVYQFYWLEMKTREIADVLACPEGTVKVYLSRARLALAEMLGDLQND